MLQVGVAAITLAGVAATAVSMPWPSSEPSGAATGQATPTPVATAGQQSVADPDLRGFARPPGVESHSGGNSHDIGTAGGFPNASTTGVPDGVELVSSGSIDVREDGAVVENLLIVDGMIEVFANDVTIRNVRITNDLESILWGIAQRSGSGLVVEDSEIFGGASAARPLDTGIANQGGMLTVRRVEIHTVTDGIMTSHGLIEGNYLHSPRYFDGAHVDMVQSVGGSRIGLPLEIRNNTIINTESQTAAVFLSSTTGNGRVPVRNVRIEGNLLGGGGYTVYGGGSMADGSNPADIVIQDNVFSRDYFPNGGYYGPVAHFDRTAPGNVWVRNVWDDDRTPVRLD